MKRPAAYFFPPVILFAIPGLLPAQSNVKTGIKGGLNFAKFTGAAAGYDVRTGFADYGGVPGAGVDVEAGTSVFTFDVRYGCGFRDVFREAPGRNGVISVTVGISFTGM